MGKVQQAARKGIAGKVKARGGDDAGTCFSESSSSRRTIVFLFQAEPNPIKITLIIVMSDEI